MKIKVWVVEYEYRDKWEVDGMYHPGTKAIFLTFFETKKDAKAYIRYDKRVNGSDGLTKYRIRKVEF